MLSAPFCIAAEKSTHLHCVATFPPPPPPRPAAAAGPGPPARLGWTSAAADGFLPN